MSWRRGPPPSGAPLEFGARQLLKAQKFDHLQHGTSYFTWHYLSSYFYGREANNNAI